MIISQGGVTIKKRILIIAIVAAVAILASALYVQADSPSLNAARDTGPHTYIVAFNDDSHSFGAMSNRMTAFAADNDAQIVDHYSLINAVAVSVPSQAAADRLSQLPGVRYVEKAVTFHASLDKAAPQVGAPVAWDSGLTGKGVTVCLVDTGIDGSHPDLKDKIVGWKDLVADKPTPYDDFGHGTHCAGIIAGTGAASGGKYRGIAPDAKLIGVKVLGKNGQGDESIILAGIEYAANSDAQVISMSLGSDEHSQAICDAVTEAVKKGKIVVVAGGNSGPGPKTIGCPSDNKNVITVGAVDGNDHVCVFSSRGPLKDGTIKPDVVAPGWKIVSCRASGTADRKAIDNYYVAESGTSMACPMVSGTVALLVQKDPHLDEAKAKDILEKTAKPLGDKVPNCDYGYGLVSVKDALAYMDGHWTAPKRPVTTPAPGKTPGQMPVKGPSPKPAPSNPWPIDTPTPLPQYPGYPSDPGSGYPQYPGYPSYPGGNYPQYPGGDYPQYPGGSYPQYPGYGNSPGSHDSNGGCGHYHRCPGYPMY